MGGRRGLGDPGGGALPLAAAGGRCVRCTARGGASMRCSASTGSCLGMCGRSMCRPATLAPAQARTHPPVHPSAHPPTHQNGACRRLAAAWAGWRQSWAACGPRLRSKRCLTTCCKPDIFAIPGSTRSSCPGASREGCGRKARAVLPTRAARRWPASAPGARLRRSGFVPQTLPTDAQGCTLHTCERCRRAAATQRRPITAPTNARPTHMKTTHPTGCRPLK